MSSANPHQIMKMILTEMKKFNEIAVQKQLFHLVKMVFDSKVEQRLQAIDYLHTILLSTDSDHQRYRVYIEDELRTQYVHFEREKIDRGEQVPLEALQDEHTRLESAYNITELQRDERIDLVQQIIDAKDELQFYENNIRVASTELHKNLDNIMSLISDE